MTIEPIIDWDKENLRSDIPDDRIIASIITYGSTDELCLISSDLGLTLKSKIKGIKTLELGDELFQELNDDKKEKEIKRLNEKINRLENNKPILALLINSNNTHCEFTKFQINNCVTYSPDEIESEIAREESQLAYAKPEINRTSIAGTLGSFMIPDEKEFQRYENESKEYLPKLREYFRKENVRRNCLSRTFEVVFCIDNSGTVPAEDIDIYMHFPDGFELLKENIYIQELEKPERPLKPQTAAEMLKNISIYPGYSLSELGLNRSINPPSKPNSYMSGFKKTHSYEVEFHIGKLKHNNSIDLKPVYIFFSSVEQIKSFGIDYKISIGNHPEVTSGKINIIFA